MSRVAVARDIATLALLLAFLVVLPLLRANVWNQATRFTFSLPVQIPGSVLPAGTYVFEMVKSFNHDIVRISNADRTKVIALIPTIPTQQRGLSGKSAIILAERGKSQPEAIIAWTYPRQLEGHEFLYPKRVESELAKDKQDTFVVGD